MELNAGNNSKDLATVVQSQDAKAFGPIAARLVRLASASGKDATLVRKA
jgi:hypothetical protein